MSTVRPDQLSHASPSASAPSHSKARRVLACVRCQKRKIKCDRRFPCEHCKSSNTQCVPATVAPRGQRKRRFPERQLLDRLRQYEDLLRENSIKFEPLHKSPARDREAPNIQDGNESDEEQVTADWSSPAVTIKSESVYEAKDYWHALNSNGDREADDDSDSSLENLHQVLVQDGWTQLFGSNDHLLFGSANSNIELFTLHPEPAQIFRLWQIYLENVNPLLKVTHCTSLQLRLVEAISDVKNISSVMEALMFSIYCMSVQSLESDVCQSMFNSSKEDLLVGYRFACQQALLKCSFLRTDDRECLTALYIYLISIRSDVVPQSLSAMLGAAIRIAQRMGIHSEATLSKCSVFEAEMRRRLWWSLVLFDTRISEMSGHKTATLSPAWDCNVPHNINDFDLRPEMQELPRVPEKSTDALFTVVRSEIGDFIRHSHFFLDFTSPALKPILQRSQDDSISEVTGLYRLEKTIEEKYLQHCDVDNPLHFMTIWWARAYIAKCRLMQYHSNPPGQQTDAHRDEGIHHGIRMLECDTVFNSSALTKRFLWFVRLHFPFPAYLHILQGLKRRPGMELAAQAWEAMSANFETLLEFLHRDKERPFFPVFAKMVLQAWEARETAGSQLGEPMSIPKIVSSVRHKLAQKAQEAAFVKTQGFTSAAGKVNDNYPIVSSFGLGGYNTLYASGGLPDIPMPGPSLYSRMDGNFPTDIDLDQLDWTMMDWNFGATYPAV